MQRPKAMLEIKGTTFLEWILRRIRDAKIGHAVVAISNSDDKIINNINLSETGIVYNATNRNMGAIGSIRSAISSVVNHKVEFLLVWPVDHPNIQQRTVNAVVEAALQFRRGVTVPILRDRRRGHPVVFSRETFSDLLSPHADQGARAVLHQDPSRVHEIEVDDPGIVANIDTPSDYQSLIGNLAP
jgi:molybdenum cofactor cytidylyltransferase